MSLQSESAKVPRKMTQSGISKRNKIIFSNKLKDQALIFKNLWAEQTLAFIY